MSMMEELNHIELQEKNALTLLWMFLDRLDKDENAHKLVTPHAANFLSQLSIATECWRQVFLYTFQPAVVNQWMALMRREGPEGGVCTDIRVVFESWSDFIAKYRIPARLLAPWLPTAEFSYPNDEPRSEATVQALRKAEVDLDRLWKHIDKVYCKSRGISRENFLRVHIFEGRKMQRATYGVLGER